MGGVGNRRGRDGVGGGRSRDCACGAAQVWFQNLLVNGHRPTLDYDTAQALSTASGIYLIPTHQQNDSFTPVPPQGGARQYLADAFQYDSIVADRQDIDAMSSDLQRLQGELHRWKPSNWLTVNTLLQTVTARLLHADVNRLRRQLGLPPGQVQLDRRGVLDRPIKSGPLDPGRSLSGLAR